MRLVAVDQPLAGYLRRYRAEFDDAHQDITIYNAELSTALQQLCADLVQELRCFKLHVRTRVHFIKPLDPDSRAEAYMTNRQRTILLSSNINITINSILQEISDKVNDYCEGGSGWVVDRIMTTEIHIAKYQPLRASSYIPLPAKLRNKRCIVNVKNVDNRCFQWSILSALHPATSHPERVSRYEEFVAYYDFDQFVFPISLNQIPEFEQSNGLAIYVYGYDEFIFPIYCSSQSCERIITLLLLEDRERGNQHYCWIKNFDGLLYDQRKHHARKYFCVRCLFPQYSQEKLNNHMIRCSSNNCVTEMPTDDNKHLKFNQTRKLLRQPCVFYADFECILRPFDNAQPDPSTSYSLNLSHHVPSGFGVIQVTQCCSNSRVCFGRPEVRRGETVVDDFLNWIVDRATEHFDNVVQHRKPMRDLTGRQWNEFFEARNCHICNLVFNCCDSCSSLHRRYWCQNCRKCISRDHCKVCGTFRGAAHSKCNIELQLSRDCCVFIHNLKNYDSHLIMQKIATVANTRNFNLECVAKNSEKYIMFAIVLNALGNSNFTWKIKFLDTFQFLPSSLENLVNNLKSDPNASFSALRSVFEDEESRQLLLRKGIYPYEYVDCFSRFDETQLPPREAFQSRVKLAGISDEEHNLAKQVWEHFECTSLGEYHDLYLLSDVLLLADVFESFRSFSQIHYGLDPAHFMTLPSLGWAACLRRSPETLELLTDPDMYKFFESGIRGGVSCIMHRYAHANNHLLDDYAPEEPSSFIISFDANNLYGYCMSQKLPTSQFTLIEDQNELDQIDIMNISADSDFGYIFDVDIDYPASLHNDHNDYPLAPEKMVISDDMLSSYCRDLKRKLGLKCVETSKLIPTLFPKLSYIVHYRNLQLYINLGLKLIKVNKAVKFYQSAWMSPYISFNTEQRKKAKNNFQKDLFKLLNNSVFGKSMENVRNYVDVRLVTEPESYRKLIASPRYDRSDVFDNELIAVVMNRCRVVLNKPIYVGFTVLELSKHLMYNFHYNHFKKMFINQPKLLYTDTDSLTYWIESSDIYAELAKNQDIFDFSDYPEDNKLYDTTNKKVMGKFKDETNGEPIQEFVGLKSKMYSILSDNHSKKRAKGVAKPIVKRTLTHQNFLNTLEHGLMMRHKMVTIQNKRHKIYTVEQSKITLSAFDNKRYINNDGIGTLAHGHCDIDYTV